MTQTVLVRSILVLYPNVSVSVSVGEGVNVHDTIKVDDSD